MDEKREDGKLKKVGNWISAILLGNTRELIARIDERTIMMQRVLEDIKPKVDDMYPKVDILWKDKVAFSHSPRELNGAGQKILKESGIKEIIDGKRAKLLEVIKAKRATNAYDAEQAVLLVVKELPEYCPDVVDRLKNGAFNAGVNIDTVLLVGGIYLRDVIFPDLGLSVERLDVAKIP
jgi:hypothetical protein